MRSLQTEVDVSALDLAAQGLIVELWVKVCTQHWSLFPGHTPLLSVPTSCVFHFEQHHCCKALQYRQY